MLPDWDFGDDDAKRRDFIEFVWAELDRFAMLTTPSAAVDDTDWITILVPGVKGSVGRPGRSMEGVNGMIWDYLLTRYMFGRYWPRKRRREAEPGHPLDIAVRRNLALPPGSRRGDDARATLYADEKEKLIAELKRGVMSVSVAPGKRAKSLGRLQAEADIAVLEALPAHLFANNFAGA